MCDVIAGALRSVANFLDGGPSKDQTCCPDVGWFEKRRSAEDYFGFDDKTCMPEEGENPYWEPTDAAKSEPANREVRDGAIRVSVEKGQTTGTRIRFDRPICAKNCTFEVNPSNVASVMTEELSVTEADFDIQGNAVGDATIKIVCEGDAIGWIHVACYERKSFKVALCEVNQLYTRRDGGAQRFRLPRPRKSAEDFQEFFDSVWRAACVEVDIAGLPFYDVPDDVNLTAGGGFFDDDGQMTSPAFRDRMATGVYPVTDAIHEVVSKENPGYDKYLYLMIPPGDRQDDQGYLNGFARGIGGDYGVFFNQGNSSLSTACHEFGHLVDLRHPNDPRGHPQFPKHLLAGDDNVPALDELNLMGYGGPRPQRKALRYRQWKSIEGR